MKLYFTQELANPKPAIAVVVVITRVDVVGVEVRIEGIVRIIWMGRAGPEVTVATLIVKTIPPVTGERPSKGTLLQHCSLYLIRHTALSEAPADTSLELATNRGQ